MKSFKTFITETSAGAARNAHGVLHELLTAKHLNGGKHVDHHPDKDGLTPKQAHDKYKGELSHEEYQHADRRAKAAAADIKKKVGEHGVVHKVHWTSKPGDIHRATGIHATQQEDPSDIVVTSKNKNGEHKHHTVSLKVAKSTPSSHLLITSKGIEASKGGEKHKAAYLAKIKKDHPGLAAAKNKPARKQWMKDNPKAKASIEKHMTDHVHNIAKHIADTFNASDHKAKVEHLRHHVLRATKTPAQEQGHSHIRHTTYRDGETHSMDPATHHDHILNEPHHITAEHRGTTTVFHHRGKPFALQTVKFHSRSDPLSALNIGGKEAGSKKDHA